MPTEQDLDPRNVAKAVFWQTVQNPLTLIMLVGAVGCLAWGGLINSAALILAVLAFGTGGAIWAINYFFRKNVLVDRHVRELREMRDRYQKEVEAPSLERDFLALGCSEGAKEASDLHHAYTQIATFFETPSSRTQAASLERFRWLAQDAYREGLQALAQALDILRFDNAIDIGTLRAELAGYVEALAGSQEDQEADRLRLEERIRRHRERIAAWEEDQLKIKALLARSDKMEYALEMAYGRVVSLGTSPSTLFDGKEDAGSMLRNAVAAAQRVEERLRAHDLTVEDEQYQRAGQSARDQTEV